MSTENQHAELWEVHAQAPDDIRTAVDRDDADQGAAAINKKLRCYFADNRHPDEHIYVEATFCRTTRLRITECQCMRCNPPKEPPPCSEP